MIVAVDAGADRHAPRVDAVAVHLERDLAIAHALRRAVHHARRDAVTRSPLGSACRSKAEADERGVRRAGLGHRHRRQRHARPAASRPARVPSGLLEVRDQHDLAAGQASTDSSSPAAARSAGPSRVTPTPGVARSIARQQRGLVRPPSARRPRRRWRRTRPWRDRRARAPGRRAAPRPARAPSGRRSPCWRTGRAGRRPRGAAARGRGRSRAPEGTGAQTPARSARAPGSAAASSGQCRMRPALHGLVRDLAQEHQRRERHHRAGARAAPGARRSGIAMASRPASSAGARNDITAPGSAARAWRGSGTGRGRAAPRC